MTDFIRRLVDRGLGAVQAGLPTPVPAHSPVGRDAELDRTPPFSSTRQEMMQQIESPPLDGEIVEPAVDSRASTRPDASNLAPAALADRSPRNRRAERAGQTLHNNAPEPMSADEAPVKPVNEPHALHRAPTPTLDMGGVRDPSASIAALGPASPSPGNATQPGSHRVRPDVKLSSPRHAVPTTPPPNREQPLPETDKAPETDRGAGRTIREAPTAQRSKPIPDPAVNLSLVERPTISPRPADSPRDISDAGPLRSAPAAAAEPAVVLEGRRPRAIATKDPALQPLSPRVQRPADLAAIMASGRAPAAERSVSVRIGTIEVRTEAPAPVAPATPPAAPPAPGFEEYAALRSYASWSVR